jgi:hypothetical protein
VEEEREEGEGEDREKGKEASLPLLREGRKG